MIFLQHSPSPADGDFFVLDSNIWLPILGFEDSLSDHYKTYFSKIMKSDSCKIFISPLQISEIANRWLRFHAYKQYEKEGKPADFGKYYKANYRQSGDFLKKYKLLKEDLGNYIETEKLELKELMKYNYGLLTDFPPDQLDFNDNYIYLFAKQHDAILITDDGDYSGLDVKVATYNKKIYTAYKNAVKPIVGLG